MRTASPLQMNCLPLLPALAICLLAAPSSLFAQSLEPASVVRSMVASPSRAASESALDAARVAGDEATLRRLQSARVRGRAPAGAESAAPTARRATTSVGGIGAPTEDPGLPGDDHSSRADAPYFGGDVLVRGSNLDSSEFHHVMASDSNDNIYVAWQDDLYARDYIQVYKSTDGGESWLAFGYVRDWGADLKEPSIAVGEGSNGNVLLLAYIRDDGVGQPVPEVARAPLSGGVFTTHSVPVWTNWEGYAKPVIITDSLDWSSWYGYLTCEGIFQASTGNTNVCTWRNDDGGSTWEEEQVPFGDLDSLTWIDPDISYGTLGDDTFLVTYCEDDLTLYTRRTVDWAISWEPQGIAAVLSQVPHHAVDPEIAAAINHDNVMICNTGSWSGSAGRDAIHYCYSSDAGLSWSMSFMITGWTDEDEFAASLTANEGGGSWHLAYASSQGGGTRYLHRPQDQSTYWDSEARTIDDQGRCSISGTQSKKGITSIWSTDEACVSWADTRDNQPGDTDTYADRTGGLGLMLNHRTISSVSAKSVEFSLNAGASNGARTYFMVCTTSGYEPGTPLSGGYVTIPINADATTLYPFTMGAPTFVGFFGVLDANGTATATLNVPSFSGLLAGTEFHFAFALPHPWDFASNSVKVYVGP
jgi:hypothetical protein